MFEGMGEMKQEEDGRSAVSAAVITFDLDTRRIDRVRSGESYAVPWDPRNIVFSSQRVRTLVQRSGTNGLEEYT